MNRQITISLALAFLAALPSGCGRSVSPFANGPLPPPPPAVIFDSGRGTGPYDEMTYYRYESEVAFIPAANISVKAIRPEIWYCNGTSGFIATIRDEHYGPVASEAGIVDGSGPMTPTFADRQLDTTVTLVAGQKYLIAMEVWTTMSVGIFTTGARATGIVGPGTYTVDYARSDTADHLDRGAVAFQLLQ